MIAIGSDHGGFELKGHIINYLKNKGFECKDLHEGDLFISLD